MLKIIRMHEALSILAISTGLDIRAREDFGNLEELKSSIKEKGVIQPILIDQDYVLIAGGRRIKASIELGLETIPATQIQLEGPIDAVELELIENRQRKDLHWWEEAKLEAQIHNHWTENREKWSIQKSASALGIGPSEMSNRLKTATFLASVPSLKKFETSSQAIRAIEQILKDKAAKKQAEEILEKQEEEENGTVDGDTNSSTVVRDSDNTSTSYDRDSRSSEDTSGRTKAEKTRLPFAPSQAWLARSFTVGDTLKRLPKLEAETFHFAEVDPPYAIDLKKIRKDGGTHKLNRYTEISVERYPDFIEKVATETYRLLHDDSFCVWWFGIEWYSQIKEILEGAGFAVPTVPAIWYKGPHGQSNSPHILLANCYETFFLVRKGSPKLRKPGTFNVFQVPPIQGSKKFHATQRPVHLMQDLINLCCPKDGHILVPFLGSGATLIGALYTMRTGLGFDLDKRNRDHFINWAVEEVDSTVIRQLYK